MSKSERIEAARKFFKEIDEYIYGPVIESLARKFGLTELEARKIVDGH